MRSGAETLDLNQDLNAMTWNQTSCCGHNADY